MQFFLKSENKEVIPCKIVKICVARKIIIFLKEGEKSYPNVSFRISEKYFAAEKIGE